MKRRATKTRVRASYVSLTAVNPLRQRSRQIPEEARCLVLSRARVKPETRRRFVRALGSWGHHQWELYYFRTGLGKPKQARQRQASGWMMVLTERQGGGGIVIKHASGHRCWWREVGGGDDDRTTNAGVSRSRCCKARATRAGVNIWLIAGDGRL